MKKHTYATQEEISEALSNIIPKNHSVMGYPRDDQIELAKEVVRRTGKSIRINAMNIHPSTSPPISTGEKIFQAVVALVAFGFIAFMVLAILVAVISMIWS